MRRHLPALNEAPISAIYEGRIVGRYFADILVENRGGPRMPHAADEAQLVNCLTATRFDVGLLINFGRSVMVKRKFRVHRQSRQKWSQTDSSIESSHQDG